MLKFKGYEGNFEILEKIGRGGFSSVYKVKSRMDDNRYAMKKIKVNVSKDSEAEREILRVLKEAKTLSKLEHPNIVRYFGSWVSEQKVDNFSFIKPSREMMVTPEPN